MATRRDLLQYVGAAGGYRAAYLTMQALGLLGVETAAARERLEPAAAHGTRVVILGAGMAGLSAAYELRKAGYICTVLEARDRVGGRNWTIRRGTKLEMIDGTRQTSDFSPGLYWNSGPARLPSHHQAILGYCRELGVPLEVEVNASRGSRLLNLRANGGTPIEMRQAINDSRGAIAELLGKAIDRGALDQELTSRDKERMMDFLRRYGDLAPDRVYRGSERAGLKTLPGAGNQGAAAREPVPMGKLLDIDLWSGMLFEEGFDFQATMFQPVGGMDQIPMAFGRKLGQIIRLNSVVTSIKRKNNGVSVSYTQSGRSNQVEADYCLITIPLKVLAGIENDFSPETRNAIASVEYGNALKIAWETKRFWESRDHIYGGISWVAGPTNLVWYPSDRFFSQTGILLGAYTTRSADEAFLAKPLVEQFEESRRMIDALHPGHGAGLQKPMGIVWSKVPYSLGISARYRSYSDPSYVRLNVPDGPFYFAGEHLSQVGAWQEGAVLSAQRSIAMIDAHRRQTGGKPALRQYDMG